MVCLSSADKGGGGSFFAFFLRTSFMDGPLLVKVEQNQKFFCKKNLQWDAIV